MCTFFTSVINIFNKAGTRGLWIQTPQLIDQESEAHKVKGFAPKQPHWLMAEYDLKEWKCSALPVIFTYLVCNYSHCVVGRMCSPHVMSCAFYIWWRWWVLEMTQKCHLAAQCLNCLQCLHTRAITMDIFREDFILIFIKFHLIIGSLFAASSDWQWSNRFWRSSFPQPEHLLLTALNPFSVPSDSVTMLGVEAFTCDPSTGKIGGLGVQGQPGLSETVSREKRKKKRAIPQTGWEFL